MTPTIAWTDSALPVGLTLDQLLYRVRRHDEGGLIFDSVTLDELLEESEEQLTLDAMVTPYNKLGRKATALQAIMARAVQGLQVVSMQVSDPFKQNGTANVVVLFELSDGQTVSVYFHNPDATPGKILPTDELVSWKWLLNKKDITIVVAPERGTDLPVREVGRRIMKLASKNSAAFARVNAQRAARLQNIAGMRSEIEQLEAELSGLQREIEVAELEAEQRALAESQKPTAEKGLAALNSVRQFLSRSQFKTIAEAMKGEEGRFFIDKAVVLAQLIDGMAKSFEQDGKDDPTAYLHYFKGSADWHITEKDAAGKGTEQAFGLSDLGQGGELGYISIDELVRNNAELDLHFDPKPLSAVQASVAQSGPANDPATASSGGAEDALSKEQRDLFYSFGRDANAAGASAYPWTDSRATQRSGDFDEAQRAAAEAAFRAGWDAAEAERFDPVSVDGYARTLTDEALQLAHQDRLDSFFNGRVIAVRNALREMGWDGPRFGDLSKQGVNLGLQLKQVGPGKNIVGVSYTLQGIPGFLVDDTLTRSPQEIAAEIDSGLSAQKAPTTPNLAWLEAAELFGKGMPGFAGAHATGDRAEIALAGAQTGAWVFAADLTAAAFRDAEGKAVHGPSAQSPADAFAALQTMPEWAALQASGEAGQLVPEGKENVVKTAKGTKIATGFTVIEADQLIASHDINGNVNPEYPQLFQPRDRSRDSSIAWIKKTAQQIDPDSLGRTSRADSGAPIVGKDRVVESGNGRTMALQEAYRAGAAEEYREWLIAEAEYFGLSPERVRAMKAPVLVRVRTTDIDRRVFAIEANQDDKLTMTGSEKARADADRLDMALLARLGDDGNLLAASNRDFVTGFLQSLGDTEAAQYMTNDGKPTGALIARIQAAVFAKAYSDDRLLELTADASRPEVANILDALNAAAPEFILARSADAAGTQALAGQLADGVEKSLDQQAVDAIIQATNLVRKVRAEGGSVEEAINQMGLFGDIPPATAAMALFISTNNRSAKRLGVAFRAMAEFVRIEAERGQTVDMFGENQQASLQQILEAANRKLDQEYGEGAFAIATGDLFAARPQPEPAAPEQPEPQPQEPPVDPQPQEPAQPDSQPTPVAAEPAALARDLFQAVIDGDVAAVAPELEDGMLDAGLVQKLQDAYALVAGDDEMETLFERAVDALTAAMLKATEGVQ